MVQIGHFYIHRNFPKWYEFIDSSLHVLHLTLQLWLGIFRDYILIIATELGGSTLEHYESRMSDAS